MGHQPPFGLGPVRRGLAQPVVAFAERAQNGPDDAGAGSCVGRDADGQDGGLLGGEAVDRSGRGDVVLAVDDHVDRRGKPLGGEREVRGHAEAAEALAEHAPALDPEPAPDQLGVANDRVSAKVGQVLGLLRRVAPAQRTDRSRASGAALIEHQHAEVAQGTIEPAWAAGNGGRTRCLEARSAGQQDQ
jgi:hypothetical protein